MQNLSKKLVVKLTKEKQKLFMLRNNLRDISDEVEQLIDDSTEAIDLLEQAADVLSRLL